MENKDILIEKFLDDSLSREEQAVFEEMLLRKEISAEEISLKQALKQILRQQQLQRLRHLEQHYRRSRRTRLLRNTGLVIMGLVALLFCILWLIPHPKQPTAPLPPVTPLPDTVVIPIIPKDKPHKSDIDTPKVAPDSHIPSGGQQAIGEKVEQNIALLDQLAKTESAFLSTGAKKEPWKAAFRQRRYPEAMKLLDTKLGSIGKPENHPLECFYAGAMHAVLPEGNVRKAISYLEIVGKSTSKFSKEALSLLFRLYWQEGKLNKARKLLSENPAIKSNLPAAAKKWLNIEEK